jgi:hypothetical protein
MHINSLVIYFFSVFVMPIIVLCFIWCLIHRMLIDDRCCLLHSMTERSFQRSHDWAIYVEPCLMWCQSFTLLPCIGCHTGCHLFLSLLFRDMLTCLKFHLSCIKIKCMKYDNFHFLNLTVENKVMLIMWLNMINPLILSMRSSRVAKGKIPTKWTVAIHPVDSHIIHWVISAHETLYIKCVWNR